MIYRFLILFFFLSSLVLTAAAQKPDTVAVKSKKDSLNRKADSALSKPFVPKVTKEKVYHPDSTHSPHKAVMRSLIVPGWGQVYNHQWWKVPLVYAGIGLLGDAILFNAKNYSEFLQLSKYREKGITPGPGDPYYNEFMLYSNVATQQIYDANDAYRRNRDLSILGLLGFWGINVLDAYIAAKFQHSYTMDNNLSIRIKPVMLNQPYYAMNNSYSLYPAIKITFAFK